jgi:hypothetical protein
MIESKQVDLGGLVDRLHVFVDVYEDEDIFLDSELALRLEWARQALEALDPACELPSAREAAGVPHPRTKAA